MKPIRLLPETLTGAAIGIAWGIASRYLPAWLYLGVTTAALAAVLIFALRTMRELRVAKQQLDASLRELEEMRRSLAPPPPPAGSRIADFPRGLHRRP